MLADFRCRRCRTRYQAIIADPPFEDPDLPAPRCPNCAVNDLAMVQLPSTVQGGRRRLLPSRGF